MRHRLFGRSHDSVKADSASNSRHSKETTLSVGPPTPDKEKPKEKEKDKDKDTTRHARARKSIDGGRGGGDRLSIFGGSFSGTLGKSRKPAPKYSSFVSFLDL